MNLLVSVASLLGIEFEVLKDRLQRNAIAYSAMAVFGLIGVVFLLVAAYTGMVHWLGPIWGPLALAGAALIVALIIYLSQRTSTQVRHRREAERRRSSETSALITSAAMTALPLALKSPLVRSVGIPAALAFGALMLYSRSGSKRNLD